MKTGTRQWIIATPTKIISSNGDHLYLRDIVHWGEHTGRIMFGEYDNHQNSAHVGFYIQWINDPDGVLRQDLGYWVRQKLFYVEGGRYNDTRLKAIPANESGGNKGAAKKRLTKISTAETGKRKRDVACEKGTNRAFQYGGDVLS